MRILVFFLILLFWLSLTEASARQKTEQKENNTLLNAALGIVALGVVGVGGHLLYQNRNKTNQSQDSTAKEYPSSHIKPLSTEANNRKNLFLKTKREMDQIKQQLKPDITKKHLMLNGHFVDDLVNHETLDSIHAGTYLKAAKDQEKLDIFIPKENTNPSAVVLSHFENEITSQNGTLGTLQNVAPEEEIKFEDQLPQLFKEFRKSTHKYMIVPTIQRYHYNATVFRKTEDPEKFEAMNIDPLSNARNTVIEHAIEAMDPNGKIALQHISAGVQKDGVSCGPLSLTLAVDLVKDDQNKLKSDWKETLLHIAKRPDYYPEGGHAGVRLRMLKTLSKTPKVSFANE